MAKDRKKKKVKSRASNKYTTSSDEASTSEDEDDLLTLFANLNMQQTLVEKGSKRAGRYIFTDGFVYQPTVLFSVAVP
jgi:hypothetical protein